MTDADPEPLSALDRTLLLEASTRFLVETEASRARLRSLDVHPTRVVLLDEILIEQRPPPPTQEQLDTWRAELGIPQQAAVVVGAGPLVWDGGADLFVRTGWILRERLGKDVHLVWAGAPGPPLEMRQLHHDIAAMGLEGRVHLLAAGAADRLALGDVWLSTRRVPDEAHPYAPWAVRGQAMVGFRTPALEEFVADDAGRLVDFLDLAGLAGSVGDLLDDDVVRTTLGETAGDRFSTRHSAAARSALLLRLTLEAR